VPVTSLCRVSSTEEPVDFLMIALIVVLSLLTWGLVRLCEKV
jgi:hypothetical protein